MSNSVYRKLIDAFQDWDQEHCEHRFHPMYTFCLKCKKIRDSHNFEGLGPALSQENNPQWRFVSDNSLPLGTLKVSPDVWDSLTEHITFGRGYP